MNAGLCVCVLLAALSSASLCLSSQSTLADTKPLVTDGLQPSRSRQARSAPAPPSGQFSNYNQAREDLEAPDRLSRLLVRILSGKGAPLQARSSVSSRSSGAAPGHRISDRDYMGWMDFGRRSAEEYEYSS